MDTKVYETLTVTIRDIRVRVRILEFLTLDPLMPVVTINLNGAPRTACSITGGDPVFRDKCILMAEELTIFYYGSYLDYLRFKYANTRVPRGASPHEVDTVSALKREIVREAEISKRRGVATKVDLYVYHYHLVPTSIKMVKEFLKEQKFDQRKDLW